MRRRGDISRCCYEVDTGDQYKLLDPVISPPACFPAIGCFTVEALICNVNLVSHKPDRPFSEH
jgi:hypothetical protein